jgi:hypothetical protein
VTPFRLLRLSAFTTNFTFDHCAMQHYSPLDTIRRRMQLPGTHYAGVRDAFFTIGMQRVVVLCIRRFVRVVSGHVMFFCSLALPDLRSVQCDDLSHCSFWRVHKRAHNNTHVRNVCCATPGLFCSK